MTDDIQQLPVFSRLGEIADAISAHGLLLLHAQPGAGKTTLVPWKLLQTNHFSNGKIILLQPRRIAARAAAERIASLLGEQIGGTVGLRTRLETIVSSKTRLEVVTEGILTRIIQNDQSLSGYGTVICDEFHERNIHGDLALALSWDCRETLRPDLNIILMSATLPADEVKASFGDIPMVSVEGRTFPVDASYHPPVGNEKPWDGAARLVREALKKIPADGDILVFLPGYSEIRKTHDLLVGRIEPAAEICVLHGRIPPDEQRRILAPSAGKQRIILSTNVAETSLTIPGVIAVVDTGLERRVRFSPRTGMDHWDTQAISIASAEQRKGRAGRVRPGICLRWWNQYEPRDAFSRPEISEADLSPLTLESLLWGASSPADLKWLTPPPAASVQHAMELLSQLGFCKDGRITAAGRKAAASGIHPRLANMLMNADDTLLSTAALCAAILEEGDFLRTDDPDFRERLIAWKQWKTGARDIQGSAVRRIDDGLQRIMQSFASGKRPDVRMIDPDRAGILLLHAFPDRAAMKTRSAGAGKGRFVLANGRGAAVNGLLSDEEFIVAPVLDGGAAEGRVFLAAPVERDDLENGAAGSVEESSLFEWNGWTPASYMMRHVGGICLSKKKSAKPDESALTTSAHERLRTEGLHSLPWDDASRSFLARCRFAQKNGFKNIPDFSEPALIDAADSWLFPFAHFTGGPVFDESSIRQGLQHYLGWDNASKLDAEVPIAITLPSGSHKTIDYESGDIPVLAARLQEFFGCITTPSVCNVPLMLHLLSPAGRPVQITRDLDGFWDRAYPEVKKELAGRYPRHYWPENPREAEPTARAKPRKQHL